MTPDQDITAIVTTLDNLPSLRRQLPILLEECGRVVVVVNGSQDGTVEWLDSFSDPALRVVVRENLGAGPGRNAGLAAWDERPTPFTLMLDGGILPLRGGAVAMKRYLLEHLDVDVISPEVATCFTTDEALADRRMLLIDPEHCFAQRALSSTAYCLCRASAWCVRFSEDGPFGEPGWGVDDNDMAFRWDTAGVLHYDFQGPLVYRRASGSFARIQKETGFSANGYGSVYEKRLVKLEQEWPGEMGKCVVVSVIIPAWNEYPLFAHAVKLLHEDLKNVPHEIIVVDNGSTDITRWWLDTFALRQWWGDATVDALTKEPLRKVEHAELADVWTGNVIVVHSDENKGLGWAVNRGFERARGKYVSILDGDILPAIGSFADMAHTLDELPLADFIMVNPWCCQQENESVTHDRPFLQQSRYGLGDLAGGYSMFRREILEAGCRFPETGPFEGAGCSFEDADFANQIYSKGFKGWMYYHPAYYHRRRDLTRMGFVTQEEQDNAINQRRKWVFARWPGAHVRPCHYHVQPPPRHLRRVALVSTERDTEHPGTGIFTLRALRQFCEADIFNPGDEPEGYDDYLYLNDWTAIDQVRHPATAWTVDFHVPHWFWGRDLDELVEEEKRFDRVFVGHPAAVDYLKERGVSSAWLPVGADKDWHHLPSTKPEHAWVAVWQNVGPRPVFLNKVQKTHLDGFVVFANDLNYSDAVGLGRCALNLPRLGELNQRVFEVMAMGVPLVTQRGSELTALFNEDEHYLGFNDENECVEKISWVQAHPKLAREMADRARRLVLSKHLFLHRMLEMFGREVEI